MKELHIFLLNRSGCSACVTPTLMYRKLKKHLKLIDVAHRPCFETSDCSIVLKIWFTKMLFHNNAFLSQLLPDKRQVFPAPWMEKLVQVGMGLLALFVLLKGNNI